MESSSKRARSDRPKKVLVTGGNGLVGSAIQKIIGQGKPSNEEWSKCLQLVQLGGLWVVVRMPFLRAGVQTRGRWRCAR